MGKFKKSTVTYADRIDRPFLILHGADDCRTLVEAACSERHSKPREAAMQLAYYEEILKWFQAYL